MVGERGFDLQRGDVLAGAADDVLAPVDKVELSVIAAAHGIAGMEPAVAPRLLGRCGVLQVAGEEAAPRIFAFLTNQEFAAFRFDLNIEGTRRAPDASCPDMPLV